MFAAKLDACECIQAVEEQPRLCAARLVSRDFLFQLSLAFFFSFFFSGIVFTNVDFGGGGYFYFFWRELRCKERIVEMARGGEGGEEGHTFEISKQRYTSNYYRQPTAGKNHSDQNI